MTTLFDTRQFVTECRDAASASDAVTATRAVVREAVRALASGVATLPPLDSIYARRGGGFLLGRDRTLFEDEAVTVVVVETEPGHLQPPHDSLDVRGDRSVRREASGTGSTGAPATGRGSRPDVSFVLPR